MQQTRKPNFFYGYYIVIGAMIILAVSIGGNNAFGVFFGPILAEFGWSRAVTSGAYSLSGAINSFGAIAAGKLSDSFGPRIVLSVLAVILALGYILLYPLTSVWQLYLCYGVLTGIGISTVSPLMSTIARWFVKRRGMMSGLVSSGTGVGTLLMTLYASSLIISYGWRIAFLGFGLLCLAAIIIAAQFIKRTPQSMGQLPDNQDNAFYKPAGVQAGFSFFESLHTWRFWLIWLIMLLSGYVIFSVAVHLVVYATELGISQTSAVSIMAVAGFMNIPSRLLTGVACDKIGSRKALMIAVALTLVALLCLLLARDLWMLYVFAAVYGFAWGSTAVPVSPMIAELFGLKSHGALYGMTNAGYTVGIAIGPVLTGLLFDVTDSYQTAFLICAGLSGVSLILSWLLKTSKLPNRNSNGDPALVKGC